jgi:hypothetical protein
MPINANAGVGRDAWLQVVSIDQNSIWVMDQWTGNSGTSSSLDGYYYLAFGL